MNEDQKVPESDFEGAVWESELQQSQPFAAGEPPPEPSPANGGAVIAGAALAWTVLKDLLSMMSAARRIAIAFHNYPGLPLTDPKYVACGGGVESVDLEIAGNHAGFVSAQKTALIGGTFGVASYRIGTSKDRLAVMWSVPDGGPYKNWFKMGIIDNNTPTNTDLFNDMYYDKEKLTKGKAAAADSGSASWSARGYTLNGVMGTTAVTTLNTSLKKS